MQESSSRWEPSRTKVRRRLHGAASAEVDVVTNVVPVPGPSEVKEAGAAMVRVSFGRAGEAAGGKAGPRWGVEEVKDKLL